MPTSKDRIFPCEKYPFERARGYFLFFLFETFQGVDIRDQRLPTCGERMFELFGALASDNIWRQGQDYLHRAVRQSYCSCFSVLSALAAYVQPFYREGGGGVGVPTIEYR